ncbi:hypothetical protein D3C78_1000760 [compost metagenome]
MHARLLGDEIGRNQDQLLVDAVELRPKLCRHQQRAGRFVVGQYFARGIPHRLAMRPDQLLAPVRELRLRPVGHEMVIQCLVFDSCALQRLFQALAALEQVLGCWLVKHKVTDRLAQGAIPVLIEAVAQLLGDRADAQQVHVSEVEVGLGVEILIPQVASADDGRAVVG